MSSHKDDLDLLLSLRERVLDTPPGSPSPHSPGYLSEDRSPRRSEKKSDMSVFRDTVRDFLDYEYKPVQKAGKLKGSKASNYTEVEKFSGLRIRNLWVGDTLSGCWATVGVLTEKGTPKTSSTGKNYCIWQVGCLDENTVFFSCSVMLIRRTGMSRLEQSLHCSIVLYARMQWVQGFL